MARRLSALEAIVLGIVQGLTEFLPISSTAHLRIVPAIVGWEDPGAAFTAVVQLGTMAAVLLYFRNDLWNIARACAQRGLLTTGSADFHGPDHPRFNRFRAFALHGLTPDLGPIA